MAKEMKNQTGRGMDALPSYRAWLCGPFRLERRVGSDYRPLDAKEWGGHSSPRTLLKALACSPRRRASRGTLLAQLWPEASEEQANRALHMAVYGLRKVLSPVEGQDCLYTEENGLGFSLSAQAIFWVDADAALALVEKVEKMGQYSPEAGPLLEEALTYFQRGAFLESDDGEWADGKRALIDRWRDRCRLWLAEAYGRQGILGQAETILNELLHDDPTNEDAVRCLMQLLHQHGLTHQALTLYRQVSKLFASEGMEISQRTATLAQQLCEAHQQVSRASLENGEAEKPPTPAWLLSSRTNQIAVQLSEQTALALPSLVQPLRDIMSETGITAKESGDLMDYQRRQISFQGAKLALGLASLPTFSVDLLGTRLFVALTQHPSPAAEVVEYLKQRINHYWEQRQMARLGSALVPYVMEDLQRVATLLEGSLLAQIRAELTVIVAHLAMLLGELLFEMNLYSEARKYYKTAAIAAHEANNSLLEAVIYGRRSLAWIYQNQLKTALSCVQRGRSLAVSNDHVTIWLTAIEAEIHAKMGNQTACLASLKSAARLRDLPEQKPFYWIHFDVSLLAGYEGACFLKLGKPIEAHQALTQSLAALDITTNRRRPRLLVDLARAYVQQGEIEAACASLLQATDLLHSIKSPLTQKRLLSLRQDLQPWQENTLVQQLDEALCQLTEKVV